MITIYPDVLFAVNFCMDYLLLVLISKIAGNSPRIRLILAGLFGGASATLIVFLNIHFFLYLLYELLTACTMIFLAFGKKAKKSFLKYILTFFLFSALLGGICFMVFLKGEAIIINGSVYFDAGISKLILCSAFFYGVISIISVFLSSIATSREFQADIKVYLNGEKVCATALTDTGNNLCEPVTGLPVCILQRNIYDKLPHKNERIYIIPYKTISGQTNVFTGVMADVLITDIHKKTYFCHSIIAPADTTITKRTEAIISPLMFADCISDNDELKTT